MKALIISALVFFSLRAMSAQHVGEDQKGICTYSNQTLKREAKLAVDSSMPNVTVTEEKTLSK